MNRITSQKAIHRGQQQTIPVIKDRDPVSVQSL